MRICIDYRPALHESTGVGTYVKGLLYGLLECYPDERITAFSASWRHRPDPPKELEGARFVDARFPVRLLDLLWNRGAWPAIERWVGPQDLVHSPSPLPLPTRTARQVVTVHDCYFLRHPEDVDGPMRRDFAPMLKRALESADGIITNTETTRRELLELVDIPEQRVHVTLLGLDPAFEGHEAPVARIAGLPARYLLFVGRREPRKDPRTLLQAFDLILDHDPDQHLVLVGPDGLRWDQTWAAASERARARTIRMPHESTERLAGIYAGAEGLLLPSRWEGFGLTAIEAMAMGTPVIATRCGALPEVLGNAAIWFDVGDARALADACLGLADDPERRRRLVARGTERARRYRWQNTARRTHELYRQLAA